ncbi:MAG TPA: hypothetical protein VEN29_19835 [Casimicrobiaceae bacterium]|nr:hypothetical protein [Casimicrobiaceae bacterium]
MDSELTFTGERFVPGSAGAIAYEHWHRYAFAWRCCTDRFVLDAACGGGHGTSLLGAVAATATSVDIDAAAHRQAEHTRQLEAQVAEREAQLARQAKALGAFDEKLGAFSAAMRTEQSRLETARDAQEQIIACRQSYRWRLRLPWMRTRLWLARAH